MASPTPPCPTPTAATSTPNAAPPPATPFTRAAAGVTATTPTNGGTGLRFTLDPAGTPISFTDTTGVTHYYLTDNLGLVIATVNASGTRTAAYDPYGMTRTKTGSAADANPLRYTSGYLDQATGLYKLGIRYCDPSAGRFTQQDPTGQEANSYLYAAADPVIVRTLPARIAKVSVSGLLHRLCRSFLRGG